MARAKGKGMITWNKSAFKPQRIENEMESIKNSVFFLTKSSPDRIIIL